MKQPMVEFRLINKWFGNNHVLKDINLEIAAGEVACVIGPSGSGKSTMLRCINLLETPDRGQIYVNGELIGFEEEGANFRELPSSAIARQRAKIGMVFQRFNLFAHLTVMENIIEAPILVKRVPRTQAVDKARELLARVGLSDKANAYPSELSGGQMQRVAIARTLAMEPDLMLFDEPTSALDPELVGEVLDVMQNLAETGITMIVVTHEISFAREIANDLIFMADGVVVERGEPRAMLSDAQNPRTREFLSRIHAA